MNWSIMFSASKFIAHLGHPRAVGSSTFPQSRHVLSLKRCMHYSTTIGPGIFDWYERATG